MHTFEGKSAVFHFDGGLKGGELIVVSKVTNEQVTIDADDAIALVAYEFVLSEKISKLEQASPEELLLGGKS